MSTKSLTSIDFEKVTEQYPDPFPIYQVLDQDGKVKDTKAIESLSDEQLVDLMKEMVYGHTFDTRMILLNRQGTLGNYAPAGGQEASQLASLMACKHTDFVVPTYRDLIVAIRHGLPMYQAFLWWRGHVAANQYPEDFQGYVAQVIVGATVAHGMGVAMAKQRKGEKAIVLTYNGDGATSQGDFYEGLNFAGVFGVPLVSIVQNNLYAISVPYEKQTHAATLAQKAASAGVPALRVDGMDPVAMYLATAKAREFALNGGGPVMIEALTYRTGPHTMSDDPKRYRSDEEVEAWEAKSPLVRLRKYLQSKNLWTEADEEAVKEEVHAAMKEGLAQMGKIPPQKVSDFLKYTFEVSPQNVAEQIKIYEAKEAK